MANGTAFKPGEIVPKSGLYAVSHREHRLRHEATLLEGEHFPACSQCGNDVSFQLQHSAVPIGEDSDFQPRKRRARSGARH